MLVEGLCHLRCTVGSDSDWEGFCVFLLDRVLEAYHVAVSVRSAPNSIVPSADIGP